MFKITSERLFWLLFPHRSSLWAKSSHFLSVMPWEVWHLDYLLVCWDSNCQPQRQCLTTSNNGSQRKREIPLSYTGANNVEAGGEACHGGRSGPPRLRPAVPLSCSSPQRTKPTQGGRGTWREKGGREVCGVQLSLCSTLSGSLAGRRDSWHTEREKDKGKETWRGSFDLMLLSLLFLCLTSCYVMS